MSGITQRVFKTFLPLEVFQIDILRAFSALNQAGMSTDSAGDLPSRFSFESLLYLFLVFLQNTKEIQCKTALEMAKKMGGVLRPDAVVALRKAGEALNH